MHASCSPLCRPRTRWRLASTLLSTLTSESLLALEMVRGGIMGACCLVGGLMAKGGGVNCLNCCIY